MKWYNNIFFYAALILGIALLYMFYANHRQQAQYVRWEQQQADTLQYYKDKQGIQHAVKQVSQIPAHLYKHIADSIVQQVAKGTKAKDLVQHSTIGTTTTARDTVQVRDTVFVVGADTAAGQIFNYNDGALNLTGLVYNQQADINYSMQLHISHTTKWQRPGWFKKKQLVVDAYSLTPHTTITGMQSFVIQQPPKRFYETKAFAVGLGFVAGFAIGNK